MNVKKFLFDKKSNLYTSLPETNRFQFPPHASEEINLKDMKNGLVKCSYYDHALHSNIAIKLTTSIAVCIFISPYNPLPWQR